MGKAQRLKRLRKLAGVKTGEEVKYDIVRTTVFKMELGVESEDDVAVAEVRCVGKRGTYREMKKLI